MNFITLRKGDLTKPSNDELQGLAEAACNVSASACRSAMGNDRFITENGEWK